MPKIIDSKKRKSGDAPDKSNTNTSDAGAAVKEDAAAPQSTPFVQRGEDAPAKRRLGFNLTEDGKIDWGSLRGKTKSELTDVLKSDPEVMALAGRSVPEEEFSFQFTEQDARLALNVLNEVNSFTTRFFFGRFKGFPIDDDVCKQAFTLKPEDEKILAERGARLANKYSGEWLRQHAELVMFMGLYFKCVTQQTMAAVEGQMIKNQIKAQQVRPNGHSAGPQAVQP